MHQKVLLLSPGFLGNQEKKGRMKDYKDLIISTRKHTLMPKDEKIALKILDMRGLCHKGHL